MSPTVLSVLLALLPAVPLAGSLAALSPRTTPRRLGPAATGLTLLLAIAVAAGYDYGRHGLQGQTDASWIPSLGVRFHLGVDGISLPLLVLTALLTFLCAVHAERRPPHGPGARPRTGLLLVLEAGMIGTFAAQDLILFFLAFEFVLIPMYLLIARWGDDGAPVAGRHPAKEALRAPPGPAQGAANRFLLYTLLGSVLMLVGFLLVGLHAGTFDMPALAARHGAGLGHGTQLAAALLIGIGLAVKAPMWPLHSWLPDAHTAAPTIGSVLLAGVLLKMGTYGLVRILVPEVPYGTRQLAPYLAAFGVVGILWGALVCLDMVRRRAADLKRIIAYSSIGHMGFVLLGIATLTPAGLNGALFANIGHGLITGLLFFLVGAVKERYGSADLAVLEDGSDAGAALYRRAPRLGGLLALGAIAGLGLPGLAGFWGELLALLGSFHADPALGHRTTYLVLMALGGLGTLLTAGYLLLMVRRVCMGPPAVPPVARHHPSEEALRAPNSPEPAAEPGIPDASRFELGVWAPLVALTAVAGLWPAVLLRLTDPAVTALLGPR
ncbi:NADH-quinone oxidoreductase subunit M [Mangrovactinospora gilvigrisea]|uniref:NADH-quinone oxidoreductase subunit M n=1 Tax=Mangrovactinospora gilvigrisea TaxID=1428644 RepID=A0A1J7BKS1_9ACTN|nr:NADH-quinone oxidoreductase subunit M [Mangrovactinospora gilvigrisea]OIV39283.1 NADH-quinone oxidoreductase subunit M [Mangrovactinospora gilvigrisea]